jgi:hypothetical protein
MTSIDHQKPRPETAIANAQWARRALDLYPVPRGGGAFGEPAEQEDATAADDGPQALAP